MQRSVILLSTFGLLLVSTLATGWEISGRGAVTHYGEADQYGMVSHTGGTFSYVWVQERARPMYVEISNPQLSGDYMRIAWIDAKNTGQPAYWFTTPAIQKEHGRGMWAQPEGGIDRLLRAYGVTLSLEEIGRIIAAKRSGMFGEWEVSIHTKEDGDKLVDVVHKNLGGPDTGKLRLHISKKYFRDIR